MNTDSLATFPLLISSGVMGYLSFWILLKLGKIHVQESKDYILNLTFISFIIFLLMWILYLILSLVPNVQEEIAILFSLIISILVSALLSWWVPTSFFEKFEGALNNRRSSEGKAIQSSKTVRQHFFDKNERITIFVFDFDNRLIASGFNNRINDKNIDPFELTLSPFNKPSHLKNYQDVIDYIEDKDINSEIFISFDRDIKIITIN